MPPRRRRARGHIEQLRSGSYRAVVYVGLDPLTRKEHYLKETANSYAQAKVALTRLQREVDEEAHPKTGLTIGQAIQQWLDVAELEDTTRERYDDLIRLYVMPTFGDLPASKLDAELLERFYARQHKQRVAVDLGSFGAQGGLEQHGDIDIPGLDTQPRRTRPGKAPAVCASTWLTTAVTPNGFSRRRPREP